MSKDIPIKIVIGNRTEYHLNGNRPYGILHRLDGPAVEYVDGTKEWYYYGLLHREDGPAEDNADGSRIWRQMGKLHRVGGPAVELRCGSKHWYQYGLKHRDGGPAEECRSGSKGWFQQGIRHRDDGPAIIFPGGDKYWYLFDRCLDEKEVILYQRRRLTTLAMTLLPLELLPYVVFWILEWSEAGYIDTIRQSEVIKMLEGLRNSRQAIKYGKSHKRLKED